LNSSPDRWCQLPVSRRRVNTRFHRRGNKDLPAFYKSGRYCLLLPGWERASVSGKRGCPGGQDLQVVGADLMGLQAIVGGRLAGDSPRPGGGACTEQQGQAQGCANYLCEGFHPGIIPERPPICQFAFLHSVSSTNRRKIMDGSHPVAVPVLAARNCGCLRMDEIRP
jgi:hypothetical protein